VDRAELEARLEVARIRRDAYSLDGGLPNETLVLGKGAAGQWEVYYSERGLKTGLRVFGSEAEATQFFLERILDDPTARRE